MPATHRSVRIDVDLSAGPVDLACLEEAAVDFVRRAPGELLAAAVQSLTGELFDVIIGPKGFRWMMTARPRRRGRARVAATGGGSVDAVSASAPGVC